MAVRAIVRIDEEKCTGCGRCIPDCAEGALQVVDGKARLVSEVYCDGLGDCLGACPHGALTIEKREAEAFDEAAVEAHLAAESEARPPCDCPGSALRSIEPASRPSEPVASALSHWPVQLRLVPPEAPFLRGADLLVCADCVPFAMGDLHRRYLGGRVVLVGCPKLDDAATNREKLKTIFSVAVPRAITVLRMEVPCCGGLASLVAEARMAAAPQTPLAVHVVEVAGGGVREA